MYEAVRQRARTSSQAAGVATTALAIAAASYVFMVGFAPQIAKAIEERTVVVIVPDAPKDTPPPTRDTLDTTTEAPPVPTPVNNLPEFPVSDDAIKVTPGPNVEAKPGPAITSPTSVKHTAPKLRGDVEKPPYPVTEIRAGHHGVSVVKLCVDARGRVTSAELAGTSGYPRLDEAALKWVRGARFAPGSADGIPESVCGHTVSYEWRLEDARR